MPTAILHQIDVDEVTCLGVGVAGGKAPTEFRIFKAGANPSVKGIFLFDQKSVQGHGAKVHPRLRSWIVAAQ